MELQIRPHRLEEIDQPQFWDWLRRASHAFLGKTLETDLPSAAETAAKSMPWQILKQRWHSLRKGFPPGKTVVWPAETLSVFIQSVHQTAPGGRWRWDEQSQARSCLPGQSEPWIILRTQRPEGLIAVLTGPEGFETGQLRDALPVKLHVTSRGDGQEQLQLAFTELQQPRDSAVRRLLTMHAQCCLRQGEFSGQP